MTGAKEVPSGCSCWAAAPSAWRWRRLSTGWGVGRSWSWKARTGRSREEPFAGEELRAAFEAEGIAVVTGARMTAARRLGRDGPVVASLADGREFTGDEILVAVGRRPVTADLGLEHVGLEPGRPVGVDQAPRAVGVPGGWCQPMMTAPAGAMAGLPEVIGLLYRAGWTRVSLLAELRSVTGREPLPRLSRSGRSRWYRAWPGQRQDNGRYVGAERCWSVPVAGGAWSARFPAWAPGERPPRGMTASAAGRGGRREWEVPRRSRSRWVARIRRCPSCSARPACSAGSPWKWAKRDLQESC